METFYVYKSRKLCGKVEKNRFFEFDGIGFSTIPNDKEMWKLEDLLPEGIDLDILKKRNPGNSLGSLIYYLDNSIGDYHFNTKMFKKGLPEIPPTHKMSDYDFNDELVIDVNNRIALNLLYLEIRKDTDFSNTQQFSLSGYQHKFQGFIKNGNIMDDYGDLIIKPNQERYPNLPINETLHTRLFEKFGLGRVINGCIKDNNFQVYHYFIKRFDFNEKNNRKDMVSLHGLNPFKDKYSGTMEDAIVPLANKMDYNEKIKTLNFFFASTLVFHNDLHKKNISFFVEKDGLLTLTPPYDIINPVYYYRDKNQCHLSIGGKLREIKIEDFRKACEILEVDYNDLEISLRETLRIYREEYPNLLTAIEKSNRCVDKMKYVKALKKSYDYIIELHQSDMDAPKNSFSKIFENKKDDDFTLDR